MGVGAVVGSAVFNVLVIPGAAGIATEEPLDSSRTLVYKEAQFYMIAVSALVVTFAMAVIYFPTGGEGALLGEMGRPLALIPLALYGLYVFIQWQDVGDHEAGDPPADVDVTRQWGLLAAGLLDCGSGGHIGRHSVAASPLQIPTRFRGIGRCRGRGNLRGMSWHRPHRRDGLGQSSLGIARTTRVGAAVAIGRERRRRLGAAHRRGRREQQRHRESQAFTWSRPLEHRGCSWALLA